MNAHVGFDTKTLRAKKQINQRFIYVLFYGNVKFNWRAGRLDAIVQTLEIEQENA
jgi:hypothetical protein